MAYVILQNNRKHPIEDFFAGELDVDIWTDVFGDGDWELSHTFFEDEVEILRNWGITEEFIEWLYERKLYYKDIQMGSSGKLAEMLRFDATPENLDAFLQEESSGENDSPKHPDSAWIDEEQETMRLNRTEQESTP